MLLHCVKVFFCDAVFSRCSPPAHPLTTPSVSRSAGLLARSARLRAAYGYIRPMVRGKAMAWRMWCKPVIQATVRSTPSPKPACGTEP